ncbi:MAG: hypothetical protein M4579_002815 [Chaenotheca gracillima]|nr:MAG: hypothetical protein M4579_002815 [Chaenotheca gracillima]
MITRHITAVTTKFNPFSRDARTARIFLSMLPPNARTAMKIDTKILARDSKEPSTLHLKFKDGKEMQLDPEALKINGIMNEVDRHSRILDRQEMLAG